MKILPSGVDKAEMVNSVRTASTDVENGRENTFVEGSRCCNTRCKTAVITRCYVGIASLSWSKIEMLYWKNGGAECMNDANVDANAWSVSKICGFRYAGKYASPGDSNANADVDMSASD